MEAELAQFQQIYPLATTYLVTYAFQILGALSILILGFLLVAIEAFGENGITLGVRFRARTELLFQARYQAHAEILRALRANDIEIPVTQRAVRMMRDCAS